MLGNCPVMGVAVKELYIWIDSEYIMGVTIETQKPLTNTEYRTLLGWLGDKYGGAEWVLSELVDGNRD